VNYRRRQKEVGSSATDSLSEDVTDIREVRNKEEEGFSYRRERRKK
jgi:hypothetical protein